MANPISYSEHHAWIHLPDGSRVRVDLEDASRLGRRTWRAASPRSRRTLSCYTWELDGYRQRHSRTLQHFLLDLPGSVPVVFRNGDPLDCRKQNLQVVEVLAAAA